MLDQVVEFFAEKILPWFRAGYRWILLIPVLVWFGAYWFAKEWQSLPDLRSTVTSPLFYITSVAGTVICLALYWYFGHRHPPEDRIVIAVTKFHPVAPNAKDEAENAYDEVVRELQQRLEANGIKHKIKELDQVVNPRQEEDRELAALLGKHNRAHIVVSATVRILKEYKFLFHPHITNLVHHTYRYLPRGDEVAKRGIEVPDQMRPAFEEEQADKIADLATLICGMARLNSGQYEEAYKILSAIQSPSPVAWFYRGFALLHLAQLPEAQGCFAKAKEKDPNFAYAWMYLGITLGKQGKDAQARKVFRHARDLVEPSGHGTEEDLLLLVEPLDKLLQSVGEIEQGLKEIGNSLDGLIRLQDALIEQADASNREGREWLERMDSTIERHRASLEYLRGSVLAADGRYKEAIARYDKALAICSDHGTALAAKGLALCKLGEMDQAVDLLQSAVKLDCDDFECAQAYAVLGDRERALDHLEIALNQHPVFVRATNAGDEFDPYRDDERFLRIVSEASKKLAESEAGDIDQPQTIQAGEAK